MVTRLLSAGLWFVAAVYAGNMLHGVVGLSELVGPIVGFTTAGLIVADPVHRFAAKGADTRIPVRPAGPTRDVVPVAGAMPQR
jgi:hypothetical protein